MRLRDWDRNLKVRLFGEGLFNVLFWMFFPFMAVYFSDAFGKGMAGFLLVLSQVFGVVTNLIGGWCADRFGRRRMMLIAAIGEGVCFLVFAFANSPWLESPITSFIAFSALGIFGSLYLPACHAMIADLVEPKHRNEVFAVFYTAMNLSVVIGPILGGMFFFKYRFGLLLFAAGSSLLLVYLIANFIRETVPHHEEEEKVAIKELGWKGFMIDQLKDYRVIARDINFLLFIVGGILIAQTFMQLDLAVAVYVTEAIPVQQLFSLGIWNVQAGGATFFGWLVAFNGFLVVLFTVWINRWVIRFRPGHVFIASALLYAVSMMMFGSSTGLWVAIGAIVVLSFAELLTVGLQESFVSELAPEHMRGQYFAAASLRYTLGRTFAPAAIPLAAWVGYTWMFIILAGITCVGAWVYHILFRRLDRGEVIHTKKQITGEALKQA
ncbi:Dipeptide/tripeptide permease [Marininema mesophilum]|uniref:Dipeptide/tripeptide permease n=1 Tax=Marininema mesophilum TaxID=1048340 RepID=A0A1H2V986_9BACL|nr:MFS transporter [Marininema mesophilum]SDW64454.1 Dipeptide/tripeptide permease [Marininema mesophilum]